MTKRNHPTEREPRVGILAVFGTFGPALLFTLATLNTTGPIATDMYLPGLPRLGVDLRVSPAAAQLTLSAVTLGLAGGQLVIGPLSDRFGRRGLLLFGLILFALSSAAAAVAPTLVLLLAARLAQGVGGAAALVIGRTLVADLSTGVAAARGYSTIGLISGVAPVLAPILGGVIVTSSGWRAVFWVLAAIGVVQFFAALIWVPETLVPENRHSVAPRDILATVNALRHNRTFVGYGIALCFGFSVLFAYISASPFVVERVLGFSTTSYSELFGVNALGLVITGAVAAALVGRVRRRTLIWIALALIGAGTALMLIAATTAQTPFLVIPALFCYAGSMGFAFGPCSSLAISAVHSARGTASALIGATQFVLAAIVSPLVGIGGTATMLPLGLTTLGALVIATAGFLFAGRVDAEQSSPAIR